MFIGIITLYLAPAIATCVFTGPAVSSDDAILKSLLSVLRSVLCCSPRGDVVLVVGHLLIPPPFFLPPLSMQQTGKVGTGTSRFFFFFFLPPSDLPSFVLCDVWCLLLTLQLLLRVCFLSARRARYTKSNPKRKAGNILKLACLI